MMTTASTASALVGSCPYMATAPTVVLVRAKRSASAVHAVHVISPSVATGTVDVAVPGIERVAPPAGGRLRAAGLAMAEQAVSTGRTVSWNEVVLILVPNASATFAGNGVGGNNGSVCLPEKTSVCRGGAKQRQQQTEQQRFAHGEFLVSNSSFGGVAAPMCRCRNMGYAGALSKCNDRAFSWLGPPAILCARYNRTTANSRQHLAADCRRSFRSGTKARAEG